LKYKSEFKIPECKNIFPLPFDFAIINNKKILGLIEYQGIQHYRPIRRSRKWSDEKLQMVFNQILKHDLIKKIYCQTNNIPFLEISYAQKDNIKTLLEEFIVNIT
jgi:translation elongation factor EF-1alpha